MTAMAQSGPGQSHGADPALHSSSTVSAAGLRSRAWFGREGRPGMIYRSWLQGEGFTAEVFDGRPVIGIANSWSELTPCNAHLSGVAEAVLEWCRRALAGDAPALHVTSV